MSKKNKWLVFILPVVLIIGLVIVGCGPAVPEVPADVAVLQGQLAAEKVKVAGLEEEIAELTAPAPETPPMTLRYCMGDPPGGIAHLYLHKPIGDEIERRTEGRVKVEYITEGVLGYIWEHYDMVRTGVCDMAFLAPGYEPGRFPLASIGSLPFNFTDGVSGSWVMMRLWQKGWFDEEFGDVKIFCLGVQSPYYIWTSEKKVTKLEDAKGLQIRVFSEWQAKAAELLGIGAPFISFGEVYTAMERGVVDGAWFSYSGAQTTGVDELSKYLAEFPMITGEMGHIINKDTWEKLSPADQRVIEDIGIEASLWWGQFHEQMATAYKPKVKEMGVEIYEPTPEQIDQWTQIVRPVWDEWVATTDALGLPGTEIMADFMAIRESIGLNWKP